MAADWTSWIQRSSILFAFCSYYEARLDGVYAYSVLAVRGLWHEKCSDHFLTTAPTSAMSAYGTNKAGDTDFRKKWDKQEYAEKAKKRDLEEKERMQENEERMKQGMGSYIHAPPLTYMIPRKETKTG